MKITNDELESLIKCWLRYKKLGRNIKPLKEYVADLLNMEIKELPKKTEPIMTTINQRIISKQKIFDDDKKQIFVITLEETYE